MNNILEIHQKINEINVISINIYLNNKYVNKCFTLKMNKIMMYYNENC